MFINLNNTGNLLDRENSITLLEEIRIIIRNETKSIKLKEKWTQSYHTKKDRKNYINTVIQISCKEHPPYINSQLKI